MTLVFDTSVLSCFARASRLPLLNQLTSMNRRRVTTREVLQEAEEGIRAYHELAAIKEQRWLKEVTVSKPKEIRYLAEFSRRLVDRKNRNLGEASALAWAKAHGAVIFSDDQTAIVLAREQGMHTLRTLVLIVDGVRRGLLGQNQAGLLVDELIGGGARFPCKGGSAFLQWANCEGLLDR
jgi:predicted nucleic acid-binding protein